MFHIHQDIFSSFLISFFLLSLFDPEDLDPEDFENDEESDGKGSNPLGIPIGSIFASIVPRKQAQNEEETNGRQKVKVEKKKSKKKTWNMNGQHRNLKAKQFQEIHTKKTSV